MSSHISRVQKPGPRPTALAWLWLYKNSGQAKAHSRPKVRPSLAWPGFWPQAGASTSLQRTWFLSASNDQAQGSSARVRCWRLVLTEHMVKLLISVGLLGNDSEAKETKKRNWNQTLSLILQLTIYLSPPPRPRRIKKVCMSMIHSIGRGGIKASKSIRCTDRSVT